MNIYSRPTVYAVQICKLSASMWLTDGHFLWEVNYLTTLCTLTLTCLSVFSMSAEEERQAGNNRNSFLANDASQTRRVTRHLHAVETQTVDTLYNYIDSESVNEGCCRVIQTLGCLIYTFFCWKRHVLTTAAFSVYSCPQSASQESSLHWVLN